MNEIRKNPGWFFRMFLSWKIRMIRSDRGFFVWLQLLPPTLMLGLAAGTIVLLHHLGKDESPLVMFPAAMLAVAALWLLRIGLSSWHMPADDESGRDRYGVDS